ncbi:MAG: phosphoglucosamine mutase, partial [Nitrospirae bacterium]|nr:phosphoglucosamine mutase [Nitrospirota bacterium]
INIPVRDKPEIDSIPSVAQAIREAEGRLEGSGRILVRYSGTEPVARVMVEGESEETIRNVALDIGDRLKAAIGA